MMCSTLSTSTAYCSTERQFRSLCTTTLATLRCTKSSPGLRPTISFAGTRLSAQPTQRYFGVCCAARPAKNPGSRALTRLAQARLLSKRRSSRRIGGKGEPRSEAAAGARQQFQAAPVRLRDALDDSEAEPGAARAAARGVEAGEGALQPLGLRFRDARTAIQHLYGSLTSGIRNSYLYGLAGIAQGVVDQVGDRAAHREAREAEGLQVALAHRDLLVDAPVVLGDLGGDGVEVVFGLLLVGAASEIEKLADHRVDLVDVGDHRVGGAALGAAHLEREAQARKR